jgi:hypothetical protein
MFASNLQELFFYCCERSDMSPQTFAEFTERFNALQSYVHLPNGRRQRKNALTSMQVASANLGRVPTRPSWAGHATTVLKSLSPVGGPRGSFHNTTSLVDAMTLLLTNTCVRESQIAVRVVLGETGVNSAWEAVLMHEHEGGRSQAYFMPYLTVSLAQEGTEI